MALNLTPSIPTPVTGANAGQFREIPGATIPASLEALNLPNLPTQGPSNFFTRFTSGGSAGGGFAGEQLGSNSINYIANLLFNRIAPSGTPTEENIQKAFKPIELQGLEQLIPNIRGMTTSEVFEALGLGEVLATGINEGNSDVVRNNIIQALTGRTNRDEGGDTSPGGPGFGGTSLADPRTSVDPEEIGALGIGASFLSPPLGAALGLGALGTSATQSLQDALGVEGYLTAPRPPLGSKFGVGPTGPDSGVGPLGDRTNIGGPKMGFGDANQRSADVSTGLGLGAIRGPGTPSQRNKGGDSGGTAGGSGPGSQGRSDPRGGSGAGPHAHTGGLLVKRGYAHGGEIEGDPGMAIGDVLGGMGGGGDPSFTPRPAGGAPDDVSITAQQGEYVIARPAIQALGVDFFNVLNDIFLKNPGLDPKAGLKAASSVIKKPESETSVAQPGMNIGEQIGAAIPSPGGPFAAGGLIGARPVSV